MLVAAPHGSHTEGVVTQLLWSYRRCGHLERQTSVSFKQIRKEWFIAPDPGLMDSDEQQTTPRTQVHAAEIRNTKSSHGLPEQGQGIA